MKSTVATEEIENLFAGLEARFSRTTQAAGTGRVTRRKAAEKAMTKSTGKVKRRERPGEQLTVRVPTDAKRAIEAKAAALGTTVTALITEFCESHKEALS